MDEFLRDDGVLTYRLIQFCPTEIAHQSDEITLVNGESEIDVTVKWARNEDYNRSSNKFNNDIDYKLFKENGIGYVSVRDFGPENEELLKQYASESVVLKDVKIIIYDPRGNTGGSDCYSRDWVKNLTGIEPLTLQRSVIGIPIAGMIMAEDIMKSTIHSIAILLGK